MAILEILLSTRTTNIRLRRYIDRGKYVNNLDCYNGPHLWSVRSSSKRRGDRAKGLEFESRFLAFY